MNEDSNDIGALRVLAIVAVMILHYYTFPRLSAFNRFHGIIDLRSASVVTFNSRDFKDGVECVICLLELVDGDKARVLPSCSHCFYAYCIDTWLHSKSTCPICRHEVIQIDDLVYQLPLSTNAADSGDQYLTAVVIDIPAELEIGELG